MNKIKNMVYLSLLIALEVIFTRFLSIETPILRIGFGFLPISMAAIMFGPVLAGTCGALADLIGMVIFPKGTYFPGFTLSAFTSAFIYGVCLYKNKLSIKKVVLSVGIISIFVDLILNTYWLSILTGKAAEVLIIPRLIKTSIIFPIHVILIYSIWKLLTKIQFMFNLNKA